MNAAWPNEMSPAYPTKRSSATAATAKTMIRAPTSSRYFSAPNRGIAKPDQQGREEGPRDRADAANDDHYECEDQDVGPHARFDRDDRRNHDTGETRQHRAKTEHDHEQPLDIDAERRD